jgi:hypothetical protein
MKGFALEENTWQELRETAPCVMTVTTACSSGLTSHFSPLRKAAQSLGKISLSLDWCEKILMFPHADGRLFQRVSAASVLATRGESLPRRSADNVNLFLYFSACYAMAAPGRP